MADVDKAIKYLEDMKKKIKGDRRISERETEVAEEDYRKIIGFQGEKMPTTQMHATALKTMNDIEALTKEKEKWEKTDYTYDIARIKLINDAIKNLKTKKFKMTPKENIAIAKKLIEEVNGYTQYELQVKAALERIEAKRKQLAEEAEKISATERSEAEDVKKLANRTMQELKILYKEVNEIANIDKEEIRYNKKKKGRAVPALKVLTAKINTIVHNIDTLIKDIEIEITEKIMTIKKSASAVSEIYTLMSALIEQFNLLEKEISLFKKLNASDYEMLHGNAKTLLEKISFVNSQALQNIKYLYTNERTLLFKALKE